MTPRSRIVGAALALAALAGAAGATAQEPGAERRACTLVLQPATDSTRSTSVEVGEDQYVTHVWHGLRWTCGDARMYADSAVKYDREGRFKAIGSVDYSDSLRTLTADTLTYYEADDRLVAESRAVLRQRGSGSTLSGPRIVFLRAASGGERRTVATRRPHLTVRRAADGDTAAPTEMDADRIDLVGRDEVRSWGEVVVERPDATARADSAFFFLEEGEGRLFGSPVVEGRSFTLSGHAIRTGFSDSELRSVEARDSARATGEGFDLYADTIRARMADRQIRRLWAHGGEEAVALAPPYRLVADSLAFDFRDGRIDTLRAVTDAEAVQVGDSLSGDPRQPLPLEVGARSWLAADTLVLAFADDTAAAPPDTAGPEDPGTDGEGTRLRRIRALGSARAYRILEPQEEDRTSRSLHYQIGRTIVIRFEDGEPVRVEGDRAIGIHLDPLAGGQAPSWPPGSGVPADSAPADSAVADTTTVADSVPADSAAAVDSAGGDPAPAPPDSTAPADTASPPDTLRRGGTARPRRSP